MARTKIKSRFVCSACGAEGSKWTGQCPDCGDWNTLVESRIEPQGQHSGRFTEFAPQQPVQALTEISTEESERFDSGIGELNRVLGGGLVVGSVVLLGGDPGIGKSTLLLQALAHIGQKARVLYISGEESQQQIALRARRLGLPGENIRLLAENSFERMSEILRQENPQVIVADSIQTFFTETLQSAPGSVAQVRETAAQLVRYAKQTGCIVLLVGHVTKEGTIAGPRILEHMVDAVLYFEGDRSSSFRLVRAIKNRFGAVNEIGVFAMTEIGLKAVSNPSAMFVRKYGEPAPGSVVLATREGSRPLLVEIQALVDKSPLVNPRRLCVGLEQNRLAMLLAVLHRHADYLLFDQDVFVNAVGGVRVNEPAADLAILVAVVSSLRGRCFPSKTVIFGEVGLAGEIRPVQGGIDRIREAEKLGFRHVILPKANTPKLLPGKISCHSVTRISEAIHLCDEI